jgi:hypothetical protein
MVGQSPRRPVSCSALLGRRRPHALPPTDPSADRQARPARSCNHAARLAVGAGRTGTPPLRIAGHEPPACTSGAPEVRAEHARPGELSDPIAGRPRHGRGWLNAGAGGRAAHNEATSLENPSGTVGVSGSYRAARPCAVTQQWLT